MTNVSRRSGEGGKTGTATIPAFRQATNAMMKSRDGGNTKTALHYFGNMKFEGEKKCSWLKSLFSKSYSAIRK